MKYALKMQDQIAKMREAGRLTRLVLEHLRGLVKPGITTRELDRQAEQLCLSHGGQCLFKGVPGGPGIQPFPGAICASINEEIVHGIPSSRAVREGDLVSVDFGVRLDGWCGDAAETFIAGQVDERTRKLVDATRGCLDLATQLIRPGLMWSSVARAIQQFVEGRGFAVVRDLTGHGIGQDMWESPSCPNYWSDRLSRMDFEIQPGLVVAVEPMVAMGTCRVKHLADGWTIITADRKMAAHFENTLAVTETGVDVLTAL